MLVLVGGDTCRRFVLLMFACVDGCTRVCGNFASMGETEEATLGDLGGLGCDGLSIIKGGFAVGCDVRGCAVGGGRRRRRGR